MILRLFGMIVVGTFLAFIVEYFTGPRTIKRESEKHLYKIIDTLSSAMEINQKIKIKKNKNPFSSAVVILDKSIEISQGLIDANKEAGNDILMKLILAHELAHIKYDPLLDIKRLWLTDSNRVRILLSETRCDLESKAAVKPTTKEIVTCFKKRIKYSMPGVDQYADGYLPLESRQTIMLMYNNFNNNVIRDVVHRFFIGRENTYKEQKRKIWRAARKEFGKYMGIPRKIKLRKGTWFSKNFTLGPIKYM